MPRARSSAPRGYANRTDLQGRGPLPVAAAPGQTYGDRAAQEAAQRSLPMAPTPLAAPAPAPGGGSPPAPPQAPVGAPPPQPGQAGAFLRPTERPNEPVTHGLPMGAGAGPEVLQGVGGVARENAMGQATLGQLLSNLAAAPGAPSAVQDLAARALSGVQ